MKTITMLFVLFGLFSQTYASDFKLNADHDIAISHLESAKIIEVLPYLPSCPRATPCHPGTSIKIEVTLKGCLDKLGPHAAKLVYNSEKNIYDLFLSAINIHTKDSTRVYCYRAPTAVLEISKVGFFRKDQIRLHMLSL